MILCSCNALSVEQVKAAALSGTPTNCPIEAYGRLQKAPKCGGCLCRARQLLGDQVPGSVRRDGAMTASA